MRSRVVQKQLAFVALLLALTACSVGTPQAHTTPKPSASGTPRPTVDAARCARLAQRGFTPCPPLPSQLKLPPTTIKNATNGAIDDATAQRWGRAYQLAQAYYYWALDQNARDAITSGVFADVSATGNLFGSDLTDLDKARQVGGVLVTTEFTMTTTQAVVIPETLRTAMERQGLAYKPYGLAVRFKGPASDSIRYPDGHLETLGSVGPDFVADLVAWGELKPDPDLGEIWYEYGHYGCEDIRSVCQL